MCFNSERPIAYPTISLCFNSDKSSTNYKNNKIFVIFFNNSMKKDIYKKILCTGMPKNESVIMECPPG